MFGWLKERKIAALNAEVRLMQRQIEALEFDIELLRRAQTTIRAQTTRKARKADTEDLNLNLSSQEQEFIASLTPEEQKAVIERIKNSGG